MTENMFEVMDSEFLRDQIKISRDIKNGRRARFELNKKHWDKAREERNAKRKAWKQANA